MNTEIKKHIKEAIISFSANTLTANAIDLFRILGYETSRQAPLDTSTYNEFYETYIGDNPSFNETNALITHWKSIDILFQLTSVEMHTTEPLFRPTIDRYEPASYLFIAIELSERNYSRNQLAQIVREINKIFPMHVFILFKYVDLITFSMIDRRPNKKVLDKDVLEKVTHVYNISITKPHAGHIQILNSLTYLEIALENRKKRIETFNDLQNGWRKVINTDVLNKQFYLDYQNLSKDLIREIYPRQIKSKLTAHQGILNLLNRIMFIYFVQKKEWIMKDINFLFHFWKDYTYTNNEESFHESWLNPIFFSAFNGNAFKDSKAIRTLPEPYKSEIVNFPYLNGGLFTFNEEYDTFVLSNKSFTKIFEFFEGYIFTITEDTPLETTLEINPELLGKMYEGMINASDLDDSDAENGIIYTERPEINFMVRRSFVEILDKKLNNNTSYSREFLYHFVFDPPAQKYEILKRYKVNPDIILEFVTNVTVCDPACGSGSMLLGFIQLQMELIRAIKNYSASVLNQKEDFLIKKRLISECIYGVDVKEWAVRIAELRLWLYMISEAEFTSTELISSPLLPNLDFKLRQGNSLLQKIGDVNFTVEDLLKSGGKAYLTGARKKLKEFINKKKEFIINQSASNTTYSKLKREEFYTITGIIDELIIEKRQQLHTLGNDEIKQEDIFGNKKSVTVNLFKEKRNITESEIDILIKLKKTIKKTNRLPFSYEIDFMEIFLSKDNPGFDLIIGNPPYVRQELILPPENAEYLENLLKPANKLEKARVSKEYKEILSNKVFKLYPFLETEVKTTISTKTKTIKVYGERVPGRSDLYTYFQLICPSYLNSNGILCFIISNSWLDVEFGSFVQQFLLKHTEIISLYDCNVRSFDAKVNTIIYLHTSLQQINLNKEKYKNLTAIDNSVRFIMNKIDFTEATYAPLLLEQENCRTNCFKELYRIILKNQISLYEDGYDAAESKQYIGDKWGSKWLYSPTIYFSLLKKGKSNFVKLSELLEKTQRNTLENFEKIVTTSSPLKNDIPFLDSSKLADKIYLKSNEVRNYISVAKSKFKKGYSDYLLPHVISNRFIGNRIFFIEANKYVVGDTFFVGWFKNQNEKQLYLASLNSSISILNVLITGRKNMGDGVLLFYGPEFRGLQTYIPKNNHSQIIEIYLKLRMRRIENIFTELGFNSFEKIREQVPKPLSDRRDLDNILFDEIGLTSTERLEIYWSIGELAQARLDKASSRKKI